MNQLRQDPDLVLVLTMSMPTVEANATGNKRLKINQLGEDKLLSTETAKSLSTKTEEIVQQQEISKADRSEPTQSELEQRHTVGRQERSTWLPAPHLYEGR
jgi:hypothetical protein